MHENEEIMWFMRKEEAHDFIMEVGNCFIFEDWEILPKESLDTPE